MKGKNRIWDHQTCVLGYYMSAYFFLWQLNFYNCESGFQISVFSNPDVVYILRYIILHVSISWIWISDFGFRIPKYVKSSIPKIRTDRFGWNWFQKSILKKFRMRKGNCRYVIEGAISLVFSDVVEKAGDKWLLAPTLEEEQVSIGLTILGKN